MPQAKCGITSGTIFVGSDTMATELKVVVDPAVSREKTLPRCSQSAVRVTDGGRVVAGLQEIAQALTLRSARRRVFRIVYVDLELGGEEVREAGVGKIQHEAGTSDEIDEVIDEAQVNRSDRTNKPSSPADSLGLAVDRFLERGNLRKYVVERRRGLVEHHRRHRTVVSAQVLDPRVARHQPQRPRPSRVVLGPARTEEGCLVLGNLRQQLKVGSGGLALVGVEKHGEVVVVPREILRGRRFGWAMRFRMQRGRLLPEGAPR